jgi:hypothetical protein
MKVDQKDKRRPKRNNRLFKVNFQSHINSWGYVTPNYIVIMSNEWEGIWKGAVVASCRQRSCGVTVQNHEYKELPPKASQVIWNLELICSISEWSNLFEIRERWKALLWNSNFCTRLQVTVQSSAFTNKCVEQVVLRAADNWLYGAQIFVTVHKRPE